jgi:uncharacterized protein (UPF0332 family)
MQGEDFLDIANRLLKIPNEAAYRTVANRAYYGVFHSINAFLAELGFKISDGPQVHGQLLARINNCGVPELKNIYNTLYDLYNRRRKADYDLNSPRFRAQASVALNLASAGQIIATIKRCKESQALCAQIRTGIREYERKIQF